MMRCTDVEQLYNNNVKFFNVRNSHSFLQHVQCLHQRHHAALKLLETRWFGVQRYCVMIFIEIFHLVMNIAKKRKNDFPRSFSLAGKNLCGFPFSHTNQRSLKSLKCFHIFFHGFICRIKMNDEEDIIQFPAFSI